jgi:hypothetical protein
MTRPLYRASFPLGLTGSSPSAFLSTPAGLNRDDDLQYLRPDRRVILSINFASRKGMISGEGCCVDEEANIN